MYLLRFLPGADSPTIIRKFHAVQRKIVMRFISYTHQGGAAASRALRRGRRGAQLHPGRGAPAPRAVGSVSLGAHPGAGSGHRTVHPGHPTGGSAHGVPVGARRRGSRRTPSALPLAPCWRWPATASTGCRNSSDQAEDCDTCTTRAWRSPAGVDQAMSCPARRSSSACPSGLSGVTTVASSSTTMPIRTVSVVPSA
jgi:hypothetical protein